MRFSGHAGAAQIVWAFLIGLIIFTGGDARAEGKLAVKSTLQQQAMALAAAAVTVGDHSYVEIEYQASGLVGLILETIAAFKAQHPELKVTSFDVNRGVDDVPSGVWLHHHPRSSECKAEKK